MTNWHRNHLDLFTNEMREQGHRFLIKSIFPLPGIQHRFLCKLYLQHKYLMNKNEIRFLFILSSTFALSLSSQAKDKKRRKKSLFKSFVCHSIKFNKANDTKEELICSFFSPRLADDSLSMTTRWIFHSIK